MMVVIIMNIFRYLDKSLKKVRPEAPKPRDANIIPPLQHMVAAAAVKIEVMLKILFFIYILLKKHVWGHSFSIYYPYPHMV
jgi:hypothetical protein